MSEANKEEQLGHRIRFVVEEFVSGRWIEDSRWTLRRAGESRLGEMERPSKLIQEETVRTAIGVNT